ncbi:hypothetical protein QOT17_013482 [Balamuthia mandrillaris]
MEQDYRALLEEPSLALAFRQYLHEVYSNENLAFWLAVENYRALETEEERRQRAQEMWTLFFVSPSQYEINIDAASKRELEGAIKESAPAELFDRCQESIWKLMVQQLFPEFLKSELYEKYCKGFSRSLLFSLSYLVHFSHLSQPFVAFECQEHKKEGQKKDRRGFFMKRKPKGPDDKERVIPHLGGTDKTESLMMLEKFLVNRPGRRELQQRGLLGSDQ